MKIIISRNCFFEISVYIYKPRHTRWDFRPPSVAFPRDQKEERKKRNTLKHKHQPRKQPKETKKRKGFKETGRREEGV
jgi:hypothetical protein